MHDPLFLSLWLKNYSGIGLPLYLKKAAGVFPHSRLLPGGVLRVYAASFQEAPQLEQYYDTELDPQAAASRAQEFLHDDCAFQLETRWDIYQWDGAWQLRPSPVLIEIYGPEFDTPCGEHARLDLGPQGLYLPQEESGQLRPVQSNIRSLLHLAQDFENELTVARRLLWSEEDEDFMERLRALLD